MSGTFLRHDSCPECGSSDGVGVYTTGSHCFVCNHHTFADDEDRKHTVGRARTTHPDLISGEYTDLPSRKLRSDTLRKYRYGLAMVDGKPVQVAPYCNKKGEVVAQKVRRPNKDIRWTGDASQVWQLFGQNVWGAGSSRMIVVTEGEIDCLTVAQQWGLKYAVVSVPDGAKSVKAIERSVDYLESFEKVVLMFDGDDAGREGARMCAEVLSPGKAYIADLPDGMDPSDLLVAGRGQEIVQAAYNASMYTPGNITSLADLIDEAVAPIEWGRTMPECLSDLYQLSFGPKPGQVWVTGAGVGIGKTDFLTEFVAHDLREGRAAAVYFGEQPPSETPKRVAGKLVGKPYFRPDYEYEADELREVLAPYGDKLHIYDHRKLDTDWPSLKKWIRYVVKVFGVESVYLDNLTLMSADADDERRFLDSLMADVKKLASQLDINLQLLSHLTTPSGTPHEEGGRVEGKQLTGSRAVMRYADFILGIERDTQSECPDTRSISTIRIIKDRVTGQSTGMCSWLRYNPATSQQEVSGPPPKEGGQKEAEASDYNFS